MEFARLVASFPFALVLVTYLLALPFRCETFVLLPRQRPAGATAALPFAAASRQLTVSHSSPFFLFSDDNNKNSSDNNKIDRNLAEKRGIYKITLSWFSRLLCRNERSSLDKNPSFGSRQESSSSSSPRPNRMVMFPTSPLLILTSIITSKIFYATLTFVLLGMLWKFSTPRELQEQETKYYDTEEDEGPSFVPPRVDAPAELTPNGIRGDNTWRSYEASQFRGVEFGTAHVNPLAVKPSHEKLSDKAGVTFNVETVPGALHEHLHKPIKSRQQVLQDLQQACAEHYTNERSDTRGYRVVYKKGRTPFGAIQADSIRLEAVSETQNESVVHMGGNGFIMACVTAFAQHLPLTLSPDQIWTLISYAFAKHVDQNSEELRRNFVQHKGKQRIRVKTKDTFTMSRLGNPDTGASAKEWETQVFPRFSSRIKEHIGAETHAAIAARFTTTTPAAQAAHEITLMSAMKNYFSYGMLTECGIPKIAMMGTLKDWVQLRDRAKQLGTLMKPEFSNKWMSVLLPILDEFVESYKGKVNHGFWQSFVKLRETRQGSGTHSFISGWIQILFPYLASGELNPHLRPWHDVYFTGPEMNEFPLVVSSAEVDWEYHDTVCDLSFHAGIIGFTQDSSTGALSPLLGWYVSHVPPKSITLQLKDYKEELHLLELGHTDGETTESLDRKAFLRNQITLLERRQ